jgi:hypothetical protein
MTRLFNNFMFIITNNMNKCFCGVQKMNKIIFLIFFIFLSNNAFSKLRNDIPIWSQVNKLICLGQYRLQCSNTICSKKDLTAKWKVDFINEKINILTIDYNYDFQGKYFKFYGKNIGSVNSILLHGRLMEFDLDDMNEGYINARVTDAIFGKNHVLEGSFYKCY